MATSLAEILADLRHEAVTSPRNDPAVATDARAALGRLRPALDRLRDEGLDTGASIDTDPEAFSRQADRVHWVMLLATTCSTLGSSVPESDSPGRLTNLADAAAVAATIQSDTATSGERWATAAALARTARPLTSAALSGQSTPEVDRALIIAEASASVLFQFAALDSPTTADTAALHRPVPNPTAEPTSIADAALDASAALIHATRPGTGPHSIADMLAIATSAAATCEWVSSVHRDDESARTAHNAAAAWTNVRDQLTPFNDGSRRPQPTRPPAVDQALALHRLARQPMPAGSGPTATQDSTPAGVVVDRLATVATHLDVALADTVASGRLMAYASELPFRDARIAQFLQGHRVGGLITVDALDVVPVRSALLRAQSRTATLATELGSRDDLVVVSVGLADRVVVTPSLRRR